jgi:hypothetical protein
MDNKVDFFDFHRDTNSKISASDNSVVTDFTLIASCAYSDETEEAKGRKIKADQVRKFIDTEKNRPLSIKQKFLNFISPD